MSVRNNWNDNEDFFNPTPIREKVAEALLTVYKSGDYETSVPVNYKGPLTTKEQAQIDVNIHTSYIGNYACFYYIEIYGLRHLWETIHWHFGVSMEPCARNERLLLICS